jgi:hypothetical protein
VVIAIYFFKKLYIGRSYVCTIYRHNSQIYYMDCGASVLPKSPMLWMPADIYYKFSRYMISMVMQRVVQPYHHLWNIVQFALYLAVANLSYCLFVCFVPSCYSLPSKFSEREATKCHCFQKKR